MGGEAAQTRYQGLSDTLRVMVLRLLRSRSGINPLATGDNGLK